MSGDAMAVELARARQRARRSELISAMAVIIAGLAVFFGRRDGAVADSGSAGVRDSVVARRVTIVDSAGKPRIELGACGENGIKAFGLCLKSVSGAVVAALEMDNGALAALRLYDEKGPDYAHRAAELRSLGGLGSLALFDGKGGSAGLMTIGHPILTMKSGSSKMPQVMMGMMGKKPRIILNDDQERLIWSAPPSER